MWIIEGILSSLHTTSSHVFPSSFYSHSWYKLLFSVSSFSTFLFHNSFYLQIHFSLSFFTSHIICVFQQNLLENLRFEPTEYIFASFCIQLQTLNPSASRTSLTVVLTSSRAEWNLPFLKNIFGMNRKCTTEIVERTPVSCV